MVHVLLTLALSLAIGATLPVAEAKRGDAGKRQPAPASPQDKPKAKAEKHPGKTKSQRQSGKKQRSAKQSGKKQRSAKPIDDDQLTGGQQPAKTATKQPTQSPQDGSTGRPPTARPSTPKPPSVPAKPATPTTGSPAPVEGPALVPVAKIPAKAPGESRRGSRRDGRAGSGGPRGDALPLSVGGATPDPLPAADSLRPIDGLERGSVRPPAERRDTAGRDRGSVVTRTVRDFVEVVPDSLKLALAALAALSIVLGGWSLLSGLRSRRLEAQRRELLSEVGLLQRALLPPVPEIMGALHTSVAYRPADGVGAGGDFYDAVPLPGGRTAFILGDISGHGRDALERTAFMRYTLRAYLEAGLEPRIVLQVAGRVVDDQLGGDFATVLIAVHDPATGSLTYASAGHPAPIIVGPSAYEPVFAASSPPLGVGVRTGLRQTTLPLAPGSVACLYTDGLTEARTERGLVGRGHLSDLVDEVGREGDAEELLRRVAGAARIVSDDMAACLLRPTAGVTAGGFRTEQLELSGEDIESGRGGRFLRACGVSEEDTERILREAGDYARRHGGAILRVGLGNRLTVEALPRNVESIEAASRRASAVAARG